MPLTGELNDLSLAELIEFFCNQRKTGRLEVSYTDAPARFFLQSGNVIHAEIGELRGIEAVYYALTLAGASFTFSAGSENPKQTINQPWTSVVLEGLRRMDEGIAPPNPFARKAEPAVAEAEANPQPTPQAIDALESSYIRQHEEVDIPHHDSFETVEAVTAPDDEVLEIADEIVGASETHLSAETFDQEADAVVVDASRDLDPVGLPHVYTAPAIESAPLFSELSSSKAFAFSPFKVGAIFAAVVLAIGVIAVPWGWYARSKAARLSTEGQPVASETSQANVVTNSDNVAPPETATSANVTPAEPPSTSSNNPAPDANAEAENKAREARLREEARLKLKNAESASTSAPKPTASATNAPQPVREQTVQPNASRKVTVQVMYDENGRVTQASGGDATALRIARQKRFPAGKAGSATITIPIN